MGVLGRLEPTRRAIKLVGALALTISLSAACAAGAATNLAAKLGSAPGAQPLHLVLPLKVNGAGLTQFALAVSTPGSPLYRQYEPISVLARRFGASRSVRQRIVDVLRANGGRDIKIDATGLFAQTTIDVGAAERLFAAPLGLFRAADRSVYVAPASQIRIPAALTGLIEGVVGLDTRPAAARPRTSTPGLAAAAAVAQPSSELDRSGTPAGCAAAVQTGAFTPNQYLAAYGFPALSSAGAQGQGEHVALVETDGVKNSDASSFASCFGLRPPTIHTYRVGIARNLAPGGEATLDAEVVHAAAPLLSSIDVYETKPELSSLLAALTAPLQTRGYQAHVISISLGVCEPDVRAALGVAGLRASQLVIAAASASGTTIVAATGDTGSAACIGANGVPKSRLAIAYPASSWFVTAVGGTNLLLDASNQIADEVVWNDAGLHLGAGGGGLSSIWTRPPYQSGVVRANARAVPDVSMLADVRPGYAIYCTTAGCPHSRGPWIRAGGTSAAAPLLGAGIALVDQVLVHDGQETLGAVNPLLYAASGLHPPSVFNDVTRIGNDVGPYIPGGTGRPLGCCTANAGYDAASGWGSVSIPGLLFWARGIQPRFLGTVTVSVLPHQHPVKAGRLVVRGSCSIACYLVGELEVQVGRSTPFQIDSDVFHLSRAGSRDIRLSFTAEEQQMLRSALTAHKKIVALAYAVLANANGQYLKYSAQAEFTVTA